jgi:hypothetical protein
LVGDAVSHNPSAIKVIEVRPVNLQTAVFHTAMGVNAMGVLNPRAMGRGAAAYAEYSQIFCWAAAGRRRGWGTVGRAARSVATVARVG